MTKYNTLILRNNIEIANSVTIISVCKNSYTFGSCSKSGPIHSSTKISKMEERNPVNWVLPPDAATANERDMEAEDGRQRKKAPNTLQRP